MTQSFILMALGIGIGWIVLRIGKRCKARSALSSYEWQCSMTAAQVRCVLNAWHSATATACSASSSR